MKQFVGNLGDYKKITDYLLPEEVEMVKENLKIGDKIRIPVENAFLGVLKSGKTIETCIVTGLYPHFATFKRKCGLTVSFTYKELLIMGVLK